MIFFPDYLVSKHPQNQKEMSDSKTAFFFQKPKDFKTINNPEEKVNIIPNSIDSVSNNE